MSNNLPADVIAALLAPIRECPVRIEWLDQVENIIGEYTGYALSGSLSFDAGQDVRRSFNLTLENSSNLFIPNGALTSQGVKLQLKRGVTTPNGITYWWSRGVYVLTDPSAVNRGSEKTVTLNGLSKWALFEDSRGKIIETVSIPKDTNIATAVKSILQLKGETKLNFDDIDILTPYTMTKEPGATLGEFLGELALIPSWELFDTVDGYWRFRPLINAAQKQVTADLSVGGTYRKLYVSGEYSPDWSQIINRLKVTGYTDPDTGITSSGIYNLPGGHIYSTQNIGERSDIRDRPELTTDALCNVRAEYEVIQNLKSVDRSSHELILLPFLTELDCVQLENTDAGIAAGKYEVQGITEDLANSDQRIEVWKVG